MGYTAQYTQHTASTGTQLNNKRCLRALGRLISSICVNSTNLDSVLDDNSAQPLVNLFSPVSKHMEKGVTDSVEICEWITHDSTVSVSFYCDTVLD